LLYLIPGIVGGTETYGISLLNSLSNIDKSNEYFIFVNEESRCLPLPDAPNIHRIVCKFHATNRMVRYFWEQIILPQQLRFYRIDLVHSLGYVGPLKCHCQSIVTIPDLNFIKIKDVLPNHKQRALEYFTINSARRATYVITISNNSKKEIIEYLGVPPEKVIVTHLGAGWTPMAFPKGEVDYIRNKYSLVYPFVVAFGGGSAHKNITKMIEAFLIACHNFPHRLVLVGHLSPDVLFKINALGPDLAKRINSIGYVPKEHIGPILSLADLFVLASLYEGFGMTVLEAQSAGVAVACSTSGSLLEVAGDGAAYFDPLRVEDMAQVIRRCLTDKLLCTKLVELGRRNLGRFSWDKTAQMTLEVYNKVFDTEGRCNKSIN
jgi:glycosyltransferase involved in cell wall biosynthesis